MTPLQPARSSAVRLLFSATLFGVLVCAPLTAGILTVDFSSPASSGTNGGLSWTNLVATTDGATEVTVTGTFTCSSACPASTFTFHFTGSGFSTSDFENGVFAGNVNGTNPSYSGDFQIYNTVVLGNANEAIQSGTVTNSFDNALNPIALGGTAFNSQLNLYIGAISAGTTLNVTDAQVSFGAAAVPEPESLLTMAGGLILLFGLRAGRMAMKGAR